MKQKKIELLINHSSQPDRPTRKSNLPPVLVEQPTTVEVADWRTPFLHTLFLPNLLYTSFHPVD